MSTPSGIVIDEVNRFMMEISHELGDMAGKEAILNELRTHLFDQAEDIAKGEVDIDTALFISMDLMGDPKNIAQRFKDLEEEKTAGFVALDPNSLILLLILGTVFVGIIGLLSAFNSTIGSYFLVIASIGLAGYVLMVVFLYLRTNQDVDEEIRSIGDTIARNLNIIAQDIVRFGRDLMSHIEKSTPREERQDILQEQYKIDWTPPKQVVTRATKPKKSAWGEHLDGIFGAIFGMIGIILIAWLLVIDCPFFVADKINLFVLIVIFSPISLEIGVNMAKGIVGRIRTTQGLETLSSGVSTICLGYLIIIFPFDFQAGLEWFMTHLAINSLSSINILLGTFSSQGNLVFVLILTLVLVLNLIGTLVGAIKFFTFKKSDIRSLWNSVS